MDTLQWAIIIVKYSNSVNKINYSHEPKLECE